MTPATPPNVPAGFSPLPMGGPFMNGVGPLYLRHEGPLVQVGFRVELRHTNPLEICHGGMLASFADMLLPISVHRKSAEVGLRFLPTISLQIDYWRRRRWAAGCRARPRCCASPAAWCSRKARPPPMACRACA